MFHQAEPAIRRTLSRALPGCIGFSINEAGTALQIDFAVDQLPQGKLPEAILHSGYTATGKLPRILLTTTPDNKPVKKTIVIDDHRAFLALQDLPVFKSCEDKKNQKFNSQYAFFARLVEIGLEEFVLTQLKKKHGKLTDHVYDEAKHIRLNEKGNLVFTFGGKQVKCLIWNPALLPDITEADSLAGFCKHFGIATPPKFLMNLLIKLQSYRNQEQNILNFPYEVREQILNNAVDADIYSRRRKAQANVIMEALQGGVVLKEKRLDYRPILRSAGPKELREYLGAMVPVLHQLTGNNQWVHEQAARHGDTMGCLQLQVSGADSVTMQRQLREMETKFDNLNIPYTKRSNSGYVEYRIDDYYYISHFSQTKRQQLSLHYDAYCKLALSYLTQSALRHKSNEARKEYMGTGIFNAAGHYATEHAVTGECKTLLNALGFETLSTHNYDEFVDGPNGERVHPEITKVGYRSDYHLNALANALRDRRIEIPQRPGLPKLTDIFALYDFIDDLDKGNKEKSFFNSFFSGFNSEAQAAAQQKANLKRELNQLLDTLGKAITLSDKALPDAEKLIINQILSIKDRYPALIKDDDQLRTVLYGLTAHLPENWEQTYRTDMRRTGPAQSRQ